MEGNATTTAAAVDAIVMMEFNTYIHVMAKDKTETGDYMENFIPTIIDLPPNSPIVEESTRFYNQLKTYDTEFYAAAIHLQALADSPGLHSDMCKTLAEEMIAVSRISDAIATNDDLKEFCQKITTLLTVQEVRAINIVLRWKEYVQYVLAKWVDAQFWPDGQDKPMRFVRENENPHHENVVSFAQKYILPSQDAVILREIYSLALPIFRNLLDNVRDITYKHGFNTLSITI